MFENKIPMTAHTASRFAMPASGQTAALVGSGLGTVAGMATAAGRTVSAYVVRERFVAGDDIATPFPGPTAWSPPTS